MILKYCILFREKPYQLGISKLLTMLFAMMAFLPVTRQTVRVLPLSAKKGLGIGEGDFVVVNTFGEGITHFKVYIVSFECNYYLMV